MHNFEVDFLIIQFIDLMKPNFIDIKQTFVIHLPRVNPFPKQRFQEIKCFPKPSLIDPSIL